VPHVEGYESGGGRRIGAKDQHDGLASQESARCD
jgi:hypothetical protein